MFDMGDQMKPSITLNDDSENQTALGEYKVKSLLQDCMTFKFIDFPLPIGKEVLQKLTSNQKEE